jgi:prevent-host-death family protein
MRMVGAYEAKTHFGELLTEVQNGETIVVIRHGVPVAHIVAARQDVESAAAAIAEYRRFRREDNITLGEGVTIRDLIEDGRR